RHLHSFPTRRSSDLATIMAIVIITGFILNRSTNLFNSLAISALIILLLNPKELFNPGFQLSFSAVLGIAILYPPINKTINKFNHKSKLDRKSTRLNSSHVKISYAVFCLKKKIIK